MKLHSPDSKTREGTYEGVSRSFRTGILEQELQMVQLSATKCSCITILWAILVSFVTITLRVASQRVFIVVISLSTQSGNFWRRPRKKHALSGIQVVVFWVVTPCDHPASVFRMKLEVAMCSEMLVSCYPTTRRHNQADHDLNLHRCENLKPSSVEVHPTCFNGRLLFKVARWRELVFLLLV
jgi:hypothetical protein